MWALQIGVLRFSSAAHIHAGGFDLLAGAAQGYEQIQNAGQAFAKGWSARRGRMG